MQTLTKEVEYLEKCLETPFRATIINDFPNILSDSTTDTLTIIGGTGISLTLEDGSTIVL